jgi:hypothetical protein
MQGKSDLAATGVLLIVVYFCFKRISEGGTGTPGDKLGPYEIVVPIGKGGMGARDTPPRTRKSDGFGFTDPNKGNSTKLTAFFSAEFRQGRSDRGSSLWSTPKRSP